MLVISCSTPLEAEFILLIRAVGNYEFQIVLSLYHKDRLILLTGLAVYSLKNLTNPVINSKS